MADMTMTFSARDVPEVRDELLSLKADNERLRALIKDAEWADQTNGYTFCPWCPAERSEGRSDHQKCPAFTPDGCVK
jgi:hypothetical protein